MLVRDAVENDVKSIVAMSRKFYATTNYRHFADMSEETVGNLVRDLIDRGIMLVAEDNGSVMGMAGLYVGPFLFNSEKTGAYEVVWWVSPDNQGMGAGKMLMDAIETSSRDKGCDIIQMVTLATSPPHAGKIYETMGYAHSETSYTKVL